MFFLVYTSATIVSPFHSQNIFMVAGFNENKITRNNSPTDILSMLPVLMQLATSHYTP